MQSGRFDQVRLIREIQSHEDHMQEEYNSSESFSDKIGDTESEAEFVTASASNNQISSEESDLEGKYPKRTYGNIIQNDNVTTESGEDESEVELIKRSSKGKHRCKRKKKRKRKERSDNQSNTSENLSSSEREISTEEEEFSDDEHVFLVTSIANLRRRESMSLQPLRVKSKEAPIIREKKRNEEKNQTLLSMSETKE